MKLYPTENSSKIINNVKRSSVMMRLIDRFIGIPLILLLSLFNVRRNLPKNITKIGFIQPTAIGDLVLSSSVIENIQKNFPNATIFVIHGKSNAQGVKLLSTKVTSICCDFTKIFPTIILLRKIKFDILIDLCPWARTTALITKFSKSRFSIGFKSYGQYRHYLFDDHVNHSCFIHESENINNVSRYFNSLSKFKFELIDTFPSPKIDLLYDNLILFHCFPGGSKSKAKSWDESNWIYLANKFGNMGYNIGFTGSGSDIIKLSELISKLDRNYTCFNLAGQLSLDQFSFVLKKCLLLVTIDTGVLHIASALETNVIGLHGPTHSRRWGAINHNSISIDSKHPDSGYISFGFESHRHENDIMNEISRFDVELAINNFLK